jgi:hypothetical protein
VTASRCLPVGEKAVIMRMFGDDAQKADKLSRAAPGPPPETVNSQQRANSHHFKPESARLARRRRRIAEIFTYADVDKIAIKANTAIASVGATDHKIKRIFFRRDQGSSFDTAIFSAS